MECFVIDNLTFHYPGSSSPSLDSVGLSVEEGDFFVLCGSSGSGKSTLLRHMKPALAPHGEQSGSIYYGGRPLSELTDFAQASEIGFVMQSPENQLVTDKVWHELAFGAESLGMESELIRRRVAEMASFFGIENWYYRNVSELSGGQKQLLALASVMVLQPKVLLLDEPTAQLDPVAAADFLQTLQRIHRELGTTVILSEHHLEQVLPMATKAALLDKGHILFSGTPRELGAYLRTEKNGMFDAMPAAMRIWAALNGAGECPLSVHEGRAFVTDYAADRELTPLAPERVSEGGEERICASGLFFRYEKDGAELIKGLDFSAHAGELVCILGGNGSGKTTTLKLLAGLKKAQRGEIMQDGKIAMLPQDPRTLFVKNTVREDLEQALARTDCAESDALCRLLEMTELCRISDLLERHPYDLSGGEQQRAALAKLLLLSPQILLLDEPTKGLDVAFKREFAAILNTLKRQGKCIVMVSHDIDFCACYADRCALLFDGNIVASGTPRAFFSGNGFYTTATNRMMRGLRPDAVTAEDAVAVLGGTLPEWEGDAVSEIPQLAPRDSVPEKHTAPRWKRIGAWVSGLGALAVMLRSAQSGAWNAMTDGVSLSWNVGGLLYGALFLLFLVALAYFTANNAKDYSIATARKTPLSARTKWLVTLSLLLIPVTLFLCVSLSEKKQYYLTSLLVLLECMLPFFLVFEGRRPKARELVLLACLCALNVAGRAAFFMLPEFKPVVAMTIIAALAFGGETGFLVGAVTMLVSNMLFSQGPWTPWQMFAVGLIGFLAGLLARSGLLRSRFSLCLFGAVSTLVVYGGILNGATALIWGGESLNFQTLAGYYIAGLPMDIIHAMSTALFLWFAAEPLQKKLERLKEKYGLISL